MIKYKASIVKDGNGFIGEFPDLPGCFSSSSTIATTHSNLTEALNLYLEEANNPVWPLPKSKNYTGDEYIWVTPSPEISIPLMIREARKKRKLTQQKAADLLGMKLQTYQKLEYIGKSNPTAMTLVRIAQAFDVKFEISA